MSEHIETLMKKSAVERENGWTKLTSEEIGKELDCNANTFRTITIGNESTCGQDGMVCDSSTERKIKDILNKYNVIDYKLRHIHTPHVYATQVILKEESYQNFIAKVI
jgi:hypothetical protein